MPLTADLPRKTTALPARAKPQPPKSVLLDLALNEYEDACAAGSAPPLSAFCAKFPAYQTSLRRMLSIRQDLEQLGMLGPTAPADWPAAGEALGKFVLERELGRGAFARVFLAREPLMGNRLVVVKLSTLAAPEAAILGPLQHKNIMPVLSLEQEPGEKLSALCMPYLGAATLVDVLDHAFADDRPTQASLILEAALGALPAPVSAEVVPDPVLEQGSYVDGVLHLGIQLADALAAAHAKGILHCDLKPSNVLLAPDGRPLLLDFNLSRTSQSQGLQAGGTVPYMAPEQLALLQTATSDTGASPPKPPTAQADVYSLGVLLCDLLTGQPTFRPLDKETTIADLLRERRNPLPKIEEMLPEVTPTIKATVLRCLAFAPEQRWDSAAALADALRACFTPPSHRRWYKVAGMTVAVAALLLLGMGLNGYLSDRAEFPGRQPPEFEPLPVTAEECYQSSLNLYRAKDYDGAIEEIGKALDKDRNTAQFFFARGMYRLMQGRFDDASVDFRRADELAPDGRYWALIAYCAALVPSGTPDAPIYYGEATLKKGFSSPQVHYNLGVAYARKGGNWPAARACMDEALRSAPDFAEAGEAYYIRAMAALALNESQPQLARALQDIEYALSLKSNVKMRLDAARLYFPTKGFDPVLAQRLREHLVQAVLAGADVQTLRRDQSLAYFICSPEFPYLLAMSKANSSAQLLSPLAFPLTAEVQETARLPER
jgi:eukaryotic-like serine/threonine-protein kinase